MTYSSALHYLSSFLNFERIPFEYQRQFNLKRMDQLLCWFGFPQYLFPSVVVAGTKGKGSTANFLSHIVSENGYQSGLYTSPHLNDPRERIRINGRVISKMDFARFMMKIRSVVEKRKKEINSLEPMTYFEIFTLLAILYFADQKIDLGIFEVGMGGRLDATNILHPLISIITSISHDHEEHLGTTLYEIAHEKAAIIKKNGYLVSADQVSEARKVIQAVIRKQEAKGYFYNDQFKTFNERITDQGGEFDFVIDGKSWRNFTIPLTGRFQIQNAALALETASILENRYDFHFKEKQVKDGLKNAFWPGRFERLSRFNRTFVLDGAHNGASMKELSLTLRQLYNRRRPVIVIFGTSREKKLMDQLKPLLCLSPRFVVTKSANPRAQDPKVIVEAINELGFKHPSFIAKDLKEAINIAHHISSKKNILVITGSLFLVGEAREILKCPKFI